MLVQRPGWESAFANAVSLKAGIVQEKGRRFQAAASAVRIRLDQRSSSPMKAHPAHTFSSGGAEAGAGAMLVACRLAGLSPLEVHYAALVALTQSAHLTFPRRLRSDFGQGREQVVDDAAGIGPDFNGDRHARR